MKYDSDEALERVLFALPLEEPPRGLRAGILAGTIYREPFPLKPWEIFTLGAVCALAVWLVATVALGGGALLLQDVNLLATIAVHVFSDTTTLAWLAAGAATAVWLSLWPGPIGSRAQTSARR
jgi:hypothetical protein